MVKRTILLTAFLSIFYLTVVDRVLRFKIFPQSTISQHQWQDNLIKAQNYLYNERDTLENVIIGTSLSYKILMDSLPKTYNLALAGQNVCDGISIILNKPGYPKTVFIEMNMLLRFNENKHFTSSANNPFLYHSKLLIPGLREGKEPITICGYLLRQRVTKPIIQKLKSLMPIEKETVFPDLSQGNENESESIFSQILSMKVKQYSNFPEQELLNENFSVLKDYISKLENKGIEVIFFEMPLNKHLNHLPLSNAIRDAFHKTFSSGKYKYIPIPTSSKYETADCIHLTFEESIEYTNYFKQKAKEFSMFQPAPSRYNRKSSNFATCDDNAISF